MNSYIYLIINTKTNKKYIGVRECDCDPIYDKYKGENTQLVKEFKIYGKKTFIKKTIALIPDKKLEEILLNLYSNYYNCTLLKEFEDMSWTKSKNKGANNSLAKKVICLNTKEVFDTISSAAKSYNLCKTNITEVCSPKYNRTFAGKDKDGNELKWMYYDEYIAKSKGEEYVHKLYGTKNTKRVKCITTGKEFNSFTDAAKFYNINTGSISNSCDTGQHAGKDPITNEKLLWERLDD